MSVPDREVKSLSAENCRLAEELSACRSRLQALAQIARLLVSVQHEVPHDKLLGIISSVVRASRIYVFLDRIDESGRVRHSLIAEWCADQIPPQIDNPALQDFAYEEFYPGWYERLASGETLQLTPGELTATQSARLEEQGIRRLLLIPMIAGDGMLGMVGYDNCVDDRPWAKEEVEFLDAVAKGLAEASHRIHLESQIRRSEQSLLRASRLEATATLAGGIAHDFNNLMVGVLGYAELLGDYLRGSPDARKMLSRISNSAKRAGELAQQMLAYAREGKYSPETLDLTGLIEGEVNSQAQKVLPDIRFERHLEAGLAKVYVDASQMRQVVRSLCLNAIEAIGIRGTVRVQASNVLVDESLRAKYAGLGLGRYIWLRIKDDGHGMPEEIRARVFEPFFSTRFQGRGLGLAAVYGIVTNHDGQIFVESEPKQGATFHVFLPAAQWPLG